MADRWQDRPFVAGSVIGVRSFRIQPWSFVLVGPVYPTVFRPGENVATCGKHAERQLPLTARTTLRVHAGIGMGYDELATAFAKLAEVTQKVPNARPVPDNVKLATERLLRHLANPNTVPASPSASFESMPVPPEPPPHRVGGMTCTCGYYAYLDTENNPHHGEANGVLGIIEGYGTVTLGNRGFRAEKAKLLALIGRVVDDETYQMTEKIFAPLSLPKSLVERYAVPVFQTVELAVAEYPLTKPEE